MWRSAFRTLVVSAALTVSLATGAGCDQGYIPQDLWELTVEYAQGFGLDPYLLAAVVWVESGYCPQAVGKDGEVGLGQIMPGTAAGLGMHPDYREDPAWSLWGAAKYLRAQWDRFQDWRLALAAYNAGPKAVALGQIPGSTQKYVRKVLAVYARFRRLGASEYARARNP